MKNKILITIPVVILALLLPQLSYADGFGDEVKSLHEVLKGIYDSMIPRASKLINVARAIAGLGALLYIASRVWRHIANAEPIEVYPLLRPFAIGMVIAAYPAFISILNGALQPTVDGTNEMLEGTNKAIEVLIKEKEKAMQESTVWKAYVGDEGTGDRDEWYRYTHPDDPSGAGEKWYEKIGNNMRFAWEKTLYNFKNTIKVWLSEVLSILYAAAALCINTIRTFYMIVLVMLGPLVLAFATFDGFTNGLVNWLGRYINVFLWLPVANIFSTIINEIQANMLKIDISQVKQYGDSFFSTTDAGYLIFMVIAIVGYTTVPSVANYIVQASGASSVLRKVTNMSSSAATSVAGRAAAGVGGIAGAPLEMLKGHERTDSAASAIGSFAGRTLASMAAGNGSGSNGNNDTASKADKIRGIKEG